MANEISPLVQRWIEGHIAAAAPGHVPVLFLSGAQGSGKSTALADAVRRSSHRIIGASLDDFYLGPRDRRARNPDNPLFAVRGPPGTHRPSRIVEAIDDLCRDGPGIDAIPPAFDNVAATPGTPDRWRVFHGVPDAVVIEGWLMGALPDPAAATAPPLNAVEARDTDGAWRRAQEADLAGPYAALWDKADAFLHILAPDFSCVPGWRLEQEAGLMASRGETMTDERREWVQEFVQYYERLTRRMLAGARRPGAEIHINAQRRVIRTVGL